MPNTSQKWMCTGDSTIFTSSLEINERLSSTLTTVFLNLWWCFSAWLIVPNYNEWHFPEPQSKQNHDSLLEQHPHLHSDLRRLLKSHIPSFWGLSQIKVVSAPQEVQVWQVEDWISGTGNLWRLSSNKLYQGSQSLWLAHPVQLYGYASILKVHEFLLLVHL